MKTIQDWCEDSASTAKSKGFDTSAVNIDQKLLLIVGEICEAQEELRKGYAPDYDYLSEGGKPEGFLIELADAAIRLCQLCGSLNLDLNHAMEVKAAYNKTRPFRHGKVF